VIDDVINSDRRIVTRNSGDRRKTERTTIAAQIINRLTVLEKSHDNLFRRINEAEYTVVQTVKRYRTDHETDWSSLHSMKDTLQDAEIGLKTLGVLGLIVKWCFIIGTVLISSAGIHWLYKNGVYLMP